MKCGEIWENSGFGVWGGVWGVIFIAKRCAPQENIFLPATVPNHPGINLPPLYQEVGLYLGFPISC